MSRKEEFVMLKQQYVTFLSVCEAGSFSKAAATLFITPSAVIQQIHALENELGTQLFVRSSKGVSMTASGNYLYAQLQPVYLQCMQIKSGLDSFLHPGNEICVGTSLMEKSRLLYNLWVLFAENHPDYEIKMVPIDSIHTIPEKADLIESVNGGMEWSTGWEFLELMRIPFGIAFPADHPMAKRRTIRPEELSGMEVVSINTGTTADISHMIEDLRAHGARVLFFREENGSSILWETSFRRHILVVPMCWQDILINMHVCGCTWTHTMPYGIFHRPAPAPGVQEFLDFIIQTYSTGNRQGIVPVL